MQQLEQRSFGNICAYYRPRSSDERVLVEVIDKKAYRRKKLGFDVEPGETWLDLGANIGAFAIYCRLRGARAECYEPEAGCFEILRRNAPGFECINAAVSAAPDGELPFWHGRSPSDHYRGTLHGGKALPRAGIVRNLNGAFLCERSFDGIKMDIEGSEGPLIDQWMLPQSPKLCLEYHWSRDRSHDNFRRRIAILCGRYEHVSYPLEFDKVLALGGNTKPYFDKNIFCWGPR